MTLIVLGDDLEPGEVTRALGVFPDRAWRRGEMADLRAEDGRSIKFPHAAKSGVWKKFLPEELEDCFVEEQLSYWVNLLKPKAEAIRDLIARDFVVELDCLVASSGTERVFLDPELLASFVEIGVEVEIVFSP